MPQSSKVLHRTFDNLAFPYVTNSSPISTDTQFVGGQNIMTSLRGYVEKYPGFAATIESVATTFNNLKRIYLWRRWDDVVSGVTRGSYFVMWCDTTLSTSLVYKLEIGVDFSAILIHTDSASREPFDFVFSNNQCYFGNGTDGNMKRYDGNRALTVYNWGIATPTVTPTISIGGTGIDAAVSYCYCITYGYGTGTGATAASVGESSPGTISACTGVFTNKTVSVGITASTDPQVNQIHVYRTTDGGALDPEQMREITGSPFANVTTTVNDTTLDADLGIVPAPAVLRNDPPTPSRSFVAYAGRIWSAKNNVLYYSGFEEIGRGVPEECWPGGLDGNNYPFESEVNNLGSMVDGVAVFLAGRVGKIEGDALDNFRRYTLIEKRGTQSRTAVTSLGSSLAWLDTSRTVWLSDLGEIGLPIRPDLDGIDPSTAYIAIHISGKFHWLVLLDGTNGLLYTFDLDTNQWLPPRDVGDSASCLISSETAPGTVDLLIARNRQRTLKLMPNLYTDDGETYPGSFVTNQFNISPEQNKSWRGVVDWIMWKRNAVPVSKVYQLTDDDPAVGTFQDLSTNIIPEPTVTQGTAILTERTSATGTTSQRTTQLAAVKFTWEAGAENFKLFDLDVASHPEGT